MSRHDEIWQMIAEKELASVWPQWKIVRLLGHGSYGNVYEIQKENFGNIYRSALKIIHVEDPSSRTAVFLNSDNKDDVLSSFSKSISNEIRIMDQLKGAPNIVVIEDNAVLQEDGEYSILIRMELLENLKDYIARKGELSVEDVIKIGIDICQALSYCQKRNIIHRDIKEDNLFFSPLGDYKIGDFGISKRIEKLQDKYNKTSIGTISYTAPEVFEGKDYDSSIDIYSLGIVLYKRLNHGRLPFCPEYPSPLSYEDIEKANRMRLQKMPLPLPAQAPEELGWIICKACSPYPEERFQSASSFKEALETYKQRYLSDKVSERKEDAVEHPLKPESHSSEISSEPAAPGTKSAPKKKTKNLKKAEIIAIVATVCLAGLFVIMNVFGGIRQCAYPSVGTIPYFLASNSVDLLRTTEKMASDMEDNTPVYFAEPMIEKSVMKALGISGEQVLSKDIRGIKELVLDIDEAENDQKISTLQDLLFFPALNTLSLSGCGLTDDVDYTALAQLPALKTLNLSDNKIGDIDFLWGMEQLTWLELGENSITDLSPIQDMTEMESLALYDNKIEDISALGAMTKLRELYLDDNKITDVSALRRAGSIEILRLDDNNITDISPLQSMSNLLSLDLEHNEIQNISTLRLLTSLQELWLGENKVEEIDDLRTLTNLTYLNLDENSITDPTPVSMLPELTDLVLSHNKIADISSLEGMAGLVYLDLSHNEIQDITPLEKMANIETLYIGKNQISDLSPLKGMKKLVTLSAGENSISDVSGLKNLTHLKSLDLYTNQIKDISPLKKLKALTWINVGRNQITDISVLKNLKKLKTFQAYRNTIADISALKELTELKYVVLDNNAITEVSSLQGLTKIERLYLEYNQIKDVSPLSNLKKLRKLYLAGNSIGDYSALNGLTDVTIYTESQYE